MRSSLYSAKVRQAPAISTRVLGNLASSSLSAEDRNYKNRNRVRSCWHRTHSEVTNQIDLSQINERTNMGTKQLSGRRKAGRSRAASQSVSQSVPRVLQDAKRRNVQCWESGWQFGSSFCFMGCFCPLELGTDLQL